MWWTRIHTKPRKHESVMTFCVWTADKITVVAEMVASHMSSSHIARKMSHIYRATITRNSVIGICHRNGIKFPIRRKRRGSPKMRAVVARLKGSDDDRDVLAPFQEYHGGEKTHQELGPGECHFPLERGDGHVFCGRQIARGSYCQHHYSLCYIEEDPA